MRARMLATLTLTTLASVAKASCPAPPEPGWCEAHELGPDGLPGTGDESLACIAGAVSGGGTPCTTHSANEWHLEQSASCTTCVHEWYVATGCSDSFSLVVRGADSLSVTVTDVVTGEHRSILATNECFERAASDPYVYCDACGLDDRLVPKDDADLALGKPAGSCTAAGPVSLPEVPCHPIRAIARQMWWGLPEDADGDGVADLNARGEIRAMDPPPCEPCAPPCTCGLRPLDNRAVTGQDVTLCVGTSWASVYRIRTVGGGARWSIAGAGGLILHDSCALAAADPSLMLQRPQLALLDPPETSWWVADDSACPGTVRIGVVVCNRGSADASSIPVTITSSLGDFDFDLAAHPTDPACQGPLLPNECRQCEFDVPGAPGTLAIDVHGTLTECSDTPGGGACGSLPRSTPIAPCACAPLAALTAPSQACVAGTATLDATGSTMTACAGAPEYRFLIDGAAIPGCDWSPSPTCAWTPGPAGRPRLTAEIRCSADPACRDDASRVVIVEEAPSFASSLVATPGPCSVALQWAAATGATVRYDVYRSDSPPVPLDAAHRIASGLTEPWFDDLGLTGSAFAYRVEAVAACGRVANGGGDLLTGPLPLAFDSALVAANEGDCAVRVTWDAADPAAGVTYDLYRSDAAPVALDAAHLVQSGLTATSFLDAPPWGTPVRYRVEAVDACHRIANGAGDSAPVTPVDTIAPSFAGIVNTRDLGFCEVEVTWDAATDPCSGVAGYNVYRDHGVAHAGETLVASMVPSSPHVDTTPGNGTWVYVVRAVDAAGNDDPNEVFQQESEGSCTNDFPRDAGLDREDGIDSPNADGGHLRLRRGFHGGLWIRWKPSPDEGGLYPVTYAVLRGSLTALRADGYTHQPVSADACGLTVHEHEMLGQADGQASYYLVAAVSGDNVTYGYDSTGARLPGELCR